MKVLMLGGTRFFGVYAVQKLVADGHDVTVATRGVLADVHGDSMQRIRVDRTDASAMAAALRGARYDVVIDNIAYASDDVRMLLDCVQTERYIVTSSVSAYPQLREGIAEDDFDAAKHPLRWCGRGEVSYDEGKRQVECAAVQAYRQVPSVRVRFPFVTGLDDYTGRLAFYVDHVVGQKPLQVLDANAVLAFISSKEAGEFLAWLAKSDLTGPINAASPGGMSAGEILSHIERYSGCRAVVSPQGEQAPYNTDQGFTLDVGLAGSAGYVFSPLESWMPQLLEALATERRAGRTSEI